MSAITVKQRMPLHVNYKLSKLEMLESNNIDVCVCYSMTIWQIFKNIITTFDVQVCR